MKKKTIMILIVILIIAAFLLPYLTFGMTLKVKEVKENVLPIWEKAWLLVKQEFEKRAEYFKQSFEREKEKIKQEIQTQVPKIAQSLWPVWQKFNELIKKN